MSRCTPFHPLSSQTTEQFSNSYPVGDFVQEMFMAVAWCWRKLISEGCGKDQVLLLTKLRRLLLHSTD